MREREDSGVEDNLRVSRIARTQHSTAQGPFLGPRQPQPALEEGRGAAQLGHIPTMKLKKSF